MNIVHKLNQFLHTTPVHFDGWLHDGLLYEQTEILIL
jgi:hypothetical protein